MLIEIKELETESELEKQIIGRSQRFGRNSKLNIWYLMHENEKIIKTIKQSENIFFRGKNGQYL